MQTKREIAAKEAEALELERLKAEKKAKKDKKKDKKAGKESKRKESEER